MADAIACAACSWPVPREFWNREGGVRCGVCGRNVRAIAFPSIDRVEKGAVPESVQAETEASCYYHPQSRATIVCESCGRFLCALCDLEFESRHICPRCFETGVSEHKIETAEQRRTLHDNIALSLSTLPMLLFWPAFICAPWALFVVFRHWNDPSSVVPRTKIRFIFAALFAIVEIGLLVFVVYMMVLGIRAGRHAPVTH